jgi:hypothetical protein
LKVAGNPDSWPRVPEANSSFTFDWLCNPMFLQGFMDQAKIFYKAFGFAPPGFLIRRAQQ